MALPAYQRNAKAKPLGVKLRPYLDLPAMAACAAILNKFPISRVVCCDDSIGPGLVIDTDAEMPATDPDEAVGAVGAVGVVGVVDDGVDGGGGGGGVAEGGDGDGGGDGHAQLAKGASEGALIRAVALANVRQLRELLKPEIEIVGAGGVTSGAHAFSLILCGASAVLVHPVEAACVDRITMELAQMCEVGAGLGAWLGVGVGAALGRGRGRAG